jgi:NAD(P)-dependent dehydrogenase (short-subunit alcohol dehydrogenase family)
MALALAPNIRVNCVAPSMVNTRKSPARGPSCCGGEKPLKRFRRLMTSPR